MRMMLAAFKNIEKLYISRAFKCVQSKIVEYLRIWETGKDMITQKKLLSEKCKVLGIEL